MRPKGSGGPSTASREWKRRSASPGRPDRRRPLAIPVGRGGLHPAGDAESRHPARMPVFTRFHIGLPDRTSTCVEILRFVQASTGRRIRPHHPVPELERFVKLCTRRRSSRRGARTSFCSSTRPRRRTWGSPRCGGTTRRSHPLHYGYDRDIGKLLRDQPLEGPMMAGVRARAGWDRYVDGAKGDRSSPARRRNVVATSAAGSPEDPAVHGDAGRLGQRVLGVAGRHHGGDAGGAKLGIIEGTADRCATAALSGGSFSTPRMSSAMAPVSSVAERSKNPRDTSFSLTGN